MSKIQERLTLPDLKAFAKTSKYIDIVARDNSVVHVRVLNADADPLLVKNALGHKKKIALADIHEIWHEKKKEQ